MGNEHPMAQTMQVGGGGVNSAAGGQGGGEMASNQSNQELDRLQERDHPTRSSNKEREGLRASQSFDESVSHCLQRLQFLTAEDVFYVVNIA
jgi:hypothetical protein